jgi:hypothetical protein
VGDVVEEPVDGLAQLLGLREDRPLDVSLERSGVAQDAGRDGEVVLDDVGDEDELAEVDTAVCC